jgi:hypothetical protein
VTAGKAAREYRCESTSRPVQIQSTNRYEIEKMSTPHSTNGHTFQIIRAVAEDAKHRDHQLAQGFLAKFRSLEDTFFKEVHPQVDMGLAMAESASAEREGGRPNVFTTHGVAHIEDLIRSIDTMVEAIEADSPVRPFTATEAYILLCAAHVHDSANVGGRDEHPRRCNDVIIKHRGCFVADTGIVQYIYNVAAAHGGTDPVHGDDTFCRLEEESSRGPRLALLGAILRLADELSENASRVPDSVAESHQASCRSKLAHAYARSFARFELRSGKLFIVYNLTPSIKSTTCNPEEGGAFLDFLEDKINRIERESIYCSNYGRPELMISVIAIQIAEFAGELPAMELRREQFQLHLTRGYPEKPGTLCSRSPELAKQNLLRLVDLFPDGREAVEKVGQSVVKAPKPSAPAPESEPANEPKKFLGLFNLRGNDGN